MRNPKNVLESLTSKAANKDYHYQRLYKATGANGIMQEKYITISVVKKDVEEARAYFARVGADLISHFAALGSKCVELDATERLRILHDFYRQGEESEFVFNAREMMKRGHSFKDYICPDGIEKNSDYLKLGDKFCRVLFLKDYASYIKDNMVTELTDMARNLMFSIDIVPVPTDEAVREVENRLLGVETNITNWQRRQNANNNFSAVVPYDMELQRKESKEFLDDLTTRDQRMMFAVMTLAITADTKEQLDSDTEAVLSVARKHMCQLAVLKFQQLDGLNTALPIGARKINAFRTLTTESLAVFIPFKVQEIQDKGGIYFGENAISHNLILCNKANLLNQSAFYLGVPGAGKSFAVKELIAFLMLHPDYADDDILICDPEGEFGALVKTLGREKATVAHLVAGGKDRLNAMYMVEGYGENNPIVEKSQFVMSLIEQIDKRGVGPQHKSIIDRCTALVYPEAEKAGRAATLCDLRRKLLEQPEDKAMRGDRKMRYFEADLKSERPVYGSNGEIKQVLPSREDSLDRLMEENARQFAAAAESVEDVVIRKLVVDKLHTALIQLTKEERDFICALFFDEKTESEVAKGLGVSQQAVHKRKNRILKKLKNFFE